MDYNFKKIENKWKKKWEEDKLFATEINSKKKFYALDMFPYPSGAGLHVGGEVAPPPQHLIHLLVLERA